MQLVNGNPEGEKVCPLGWQLLVMDHGTIMPGAPQQPANVAPNCVRDRCALWNEQASACALAALATESQRRTDLAEQQFAAQEQRTAELLKAAADAQRQSLELGKEHLDVAKQHAEAVRELREEPNDAPANRIRRELDGDADGGPSRN